MHENLYETLRNIKDLRELFSLYQHIQEQLREVKTLYDLYPPLYCEAKSAYLLRMLNEQGIGDTMSNKMYDVDISLFNQNT